MKGFRESLWNRRKLIELVSLSELLEEYTIVRREFKLSEVIDNQNEEYYVLYDNMHDCIVDYCNEDDLINFCNHIASLCNEFTSINYGYVFPEKVTNIRYAEKLIKSGSIACYQYQYATNLFIIKYLGNDLFAIYDI